MIDKKELIAHFTGEELNLAQSVLEKANISMQYETTIFTQDFLTPNIWNFFYKRLSNVMKIECNGVFEESERRMISFNNGYNTPYPITVLKIINNSKFKVLEHKDYLGAILSLGIKRNKIGDLVIKDNKCYFVACEEIGKFIIENLISVGKNPCTVELVAGIEELPHMDFTESIISVASLRADAVVSEIANCSRANAVKLVDSGKVLIDYSDDINKSSEVKLDSRITIRGTGKYLISEIVGKTKSDKLRIKIKKYT
ncbi:RNA-binding protein [Clostridium sp. YIM B02551]|uniref:YlmH family RNA-binding protein n=1 Tax=Clostridium sp. YIM B02551 TaxID=2910679 RepID=UPI001EEA7A9E|nr:YlmH/Sll1252 family protein [Clostridium sp. YIM B02551]